MKNQKLAITILAPCLALLLANCTAKVDADSETPSNMPNANKLFNEPAVSGPDILGQWQSACVEDFMGSGTRQVTMNFSTTSNFKYTNVSYSDRACTKIVKTENHEGAYQFTTKMSDKLYRIDYNYKLNGATYKMNDQHLEFNSNTIYISELVFGNTDVNRDLPLKKIAAAQASPIGQAPITSSCVDYSGTYQMNSDYFRIEQTACSKLTWVYIATYDNPTESRTEYLVDGQSHLVNGSPMTATLNSKGQLSVQFQSSGGYNLVKVYSFQKDPCELSNPSGENYLTRDVYYNGAAQSDSCMYWAKR